MMPRAAVPALLLAALVAGCQDNRADERLLEEGAESGFRSDVASPWVLLLTDRASYEDFYRQHASARFSGAPPDPPRVDFGVEAVLAVVLGPRATTGHSVSADIHYHGPGEPLEVDVVERVAGEGCVNAPRTTVPYAIYAVPLARFAPDMGFRAKHVEQVRDCTDGA